MSWSILRWHKHTYPQVIFSIITVKYNKRVYICAFNAQPMCACVHFILCIYYGLFVFNKHLHIIIKIIFLGILNYCLYAWVASCHVFSCSSIYLAASTPWACHQTRGSSVLGLWLHCPASLLLPAVLEVSGKGHLLSRSAETDTVVHNSDSGRQSDVPTTMTWRMLD